MQKPTEDEVYAEYQKIDAMVREYVEEKGVEGTLTQEQISTLVMGMFANTNARLRKIEELLFCEHEFETKSVGGDPQEFREHVAVCRKCGAEPSITG